MSFWAEFPVRLHQTRIQRRLALSSTENFILLCSQEDSNIQFIEKAVLSIRSSQCMLSTAGSLFPWIPYQRSQLTMYQNYPRKEIDTEHLYTFIVVILETKCQITGIFMVTALYWAQVIWRWLAVDGRHCAGSVRNLPLDLTDWSMTWNLSLKGTKGWMHS